MAEGVRRALPEAETVLCPMADGGHGTLETLLAATSGESFSTRATGPLGRPVEARWGVLGDGATAVVEMAQASGLTLVPSGQLDPMAATTYGTGQLIREALSAGYRRLVVGVGGSATNDGGAGAAQALGVGLTDDDGTDIPFGAAGLLRLARVDLSGLEPAVRECDIQVATDVTNPLVGPHGAAMVYGPQKGARPEHLPPLDAALANLARVVHRDLDINLRDLPGGGAAGGLAAGLVAFLGAHLVWGVDLVSEAVALDSKLRDADLVITGEGRMDAQTAARKAPLGVAQRARALGVPVIAVVGSLGPGYQEAMAHGIDLVEAASGEGIPPPEEAEAAVALLVEATVRALGRLHPTPPGGAKKPRP